MALEKVFTLTLRKILLCDYLYYFLFSLACLFLLLKINASYNYFSYEEESNFTGIITDIYQDSEKIVLEVKADTKVKGTYYYEGDIPLLSLGDEVTLYGSFALPATNTNPNLFNYRNYLKSKNIYYLFSVDEIEKNKDNNNIFYHIKNYLTSKIKTNSSYKYLYTFILGDNRYLDSSVKSNYQTLGISHLFTISGMHISILSMLVIFLLKKLKISEEKRNIICCMFIIFYMFLVNFCPSVLRSGIFFILITFNKIYYFNIKPINLLLLTISIILFINPFIIYNTGFLYSCIISWALIRFGFVLNNYDNYFIKLFFMSLIAFLFSFPISIYSSYQVNILTIFYNLVFVPIVSLIIFPLSLLCLFFSFLAPSLNILINIIEWLANTLYLDRTNLIFIKPNLIILFFYYLIIYGLLSYQKKFLYLIFFIFLFIHYNYNIIFPNNYMLMIDVGQGDSILLHSGKYNILVDTGGNNYNNSYLSDNVLIPLFKSLGIRKIDYLFLSHGDYDHVGESINLLENFNIGQVYFNEGELSYNEQIIIKVLEEKQIYHAISYEGSIYEIGDYTLYSLGHNLNDENDSSMILYGIVNNYSFLLMGDASTTSEEVLMRKYDLKDIDILKVGHHGSKTSTSEEFLSKLNLRYGLISVGIDNKYNHPHQEVLDLLNKYRVRTYITSRDGAILIKFKKNVTFLTFCS